MRVNHRSLDVLVPEQFLDSSDIVAGFQQVGGEAVAEGMAGNALLETCELRGAADMLLEAAGAHVMTAHDAGPWVKGD